MANPKSKTKQQPYALLPVERSIAERIKSEAQSKGMLLWKYASQLLSGVKQNEQ